MPDELWTEICDIVQETWRKTIPKRKKMVLGDWKTEESCITIRYNKNDSIHKKKDS